MASHAAHNENEKRLLHSLILILSFMGFEIAGGLFSGSLLLITDAGHMLIDAIALVLAIYATRASKKPADSMHSYGYHRSQVLAAFINSITLFITTIWILIEGVKRILHPEHVSGKTVVAIGSIGVIINLYMALSLRQGSKDNINMKSAFVHIYGDLLGYVATVISGIIVTYTGWMRVDPILSIIFALVITKSAWSIAKDAITVLMEGAPSSIQNKEIISRLKDKLPEIMDVHHIHIWSITPENIIFTAHVKVASAAKNYHLISTIKRILKMEFGIAHTTIEVEDERCSEEDQQDDHLFEL